MKKRLLTLIVLSSFVTNLFTGVTAYASIKSKGLDAAKVQEKNERLELPDIAKDYENMQNIKYYDLDILARFENIVNTLNTKENKDKFIITTQEISDIQSILGSYKKQISSEYIGMEFNSSDKLFLIRQKIANYCNLLANSRNTDKKIKDELNNILNDLVSTNDKLLEALIKLVESLIDTSSNKIDKNVLIEIETNKDSALQIGKSGGQIQSVDIQKYMYQKGLGIIKNCGIDLNDKEKDTDSDKVPDINEIILGSNINKVDSDEDGLTDYQEYKVFPFLSLTNKDSDGDGITDDKEDLDGDKLTNKDEYDNNTNLMNKDSDSDGLDDRFEVIEFKSNPNKKDTDDDGIKDYEEYLLGTDPNNKDTDGDGIEDSKESYEKEVEEAEIKVQIKGDHNSIKTIDINELERKDGYKMPGQISDTYSITSSGSFEEATLKFKIDDSKLKNRNTKNLKVVYYDEKGKVIKEVEGEQGFNEETNEIWAKTNHFTEFTVLDIKEWRKDWLEYDASNRPSDGNNIKYLDCAIVIDSSGSMQSNDPKMLRVEAAQNFVDTLMDRDQAAIVDLDSYSWVLQELTSDKSLLKSALSKINSSGGTDIDGAVNKAIDTLKDTQKDRSRYAILLTDGEDYSYNYRVNDRAKDEGIIFYTISLGTERGSAPLKDLSSKTGGKYFFLKTADQIDGIFDGIAGETTGGTDTDGDGLSDELEKNGIRAGNGQIYKTDPEKADTDGDGILDGQEVGVKQYIPQQIEGDYPKGTSEDGIYEYDGGKYFKVLSDPTKIDTDRDGLNDAEEIEVGYPVFFDDKDGDKLIDGIEIKYGTSPVKKDTDGDNNQGFDIDLSDYGECMSSDYDPLYYDKLMSTGDYFIEFAAGYLGGDFLDDPTITNIVGMLVSSVASFGLGDIRDAIAAIFKGDITSMLLNLAGVVPAIGDAAAGANKICNILEKIKYTGKISDVLIFISKWDAIPHSAKLKVTKYSLELTGYTSLFIEFFYGDLVKGKISPEEINNRLAEIINFLTKNNLNIKNFGKQLEKCIDESRYFFSQYPEARKLIRDTLNNAEEINVKNLIEQLSIDIKKVSLDNPWDNKDAFIAFLKRVQGWTCENLTANKYINDGFTNISNKSGVLEHGPDGIFKRGNEYVITECKAWKNSLDIGNLPKYLIKENGEYYFNFEYIKGFVDDEVVFNEIIQSALNGQVSFDIATLKQKAGNNVNSGELTARLKELVGKEIKIKYKGLDGKGARIKIENTKF